MEKKCFNCTKMDICIAYHKLSEMAGILNNVMLDSVLGENGFTVMINTMAHDCTHFEKSKKSD